jgi:hypothetical protein
VRIAIEDMADPRHHFLAEQTHRTLDRVIRHRAQFEIVASPISSSFPAIRKIASATVSGLPRMTMSFATIWSKSIACSIGACRRQKS